jgi:hypothetical protein
MVGLAYDREQILGAIGHAGALRYEPSPFGPMSAREAIASYYARRKITVSPEDVAIVATTSEAYSFLFRLLANAGESISVPRPSYPLFNFLADLSDVVLAPYHLRYGEREGWRLDEASVVESLDDTSRALIAVSPNNPTGSCFNEKEKAALAKLAAARELALISDEVFLDYLADRDQTALASFIGTRDALAFSLSGLSKVAGLPQMKIAWIVLSGPEELRKEARARLEIIADTHLSVSTPVVRALPELLDIAEAFQERLRARLEENRRTLAEMKLPARSADGGWYAMIDLPSEKDDEAWAVELIEKKKVLVHPGYLFDVEEPSAIVVSTLVERERFREGMKRIGASLK